MELKRVNQEINTELKRVNQEINMELKRVNQEINMEFKRVKQEITWNLIQHISYHVLFSRFFPQISYFGFHMLNGLHKYKSQ